MITAPASRASSIWMGIATLQVMVILVSGAAFSLAWAPEPHSDWLLYWHSAGDPGTYERGGLGLWLLAFPKALGVAPHIAALWLNLPAAAWLCALAYRVDRTRFRIFAQLTAGYLLLISPYFGVVQLDLVGAAFLATGLWALLGELPARRGHASRVGIAVVAIAVAVSTRPQYALVLWALIGLLAVGWFVGQRWNLHRLALVVAGLLVGSVAGFGVDMGLRLASGNTEQIRTSSAVTLYAGLLASSDSRADRCGQWTPEAAQAARDDMHLPLASAIYQRLVSHPPMHWAKVLGCKAPQIVSPPAYALYWSLESPNVVAAREKREDGGRFEAQYAAATKWEKRVVRLLGVAILIACACSAWRGWQARSLIPALLPLAWVAAFWLVHMVFEIQGRYFLGLYVVAPLLCAMVWEMASRPKQLPRVAAGAS